MSMEPMTCAATPVRRAIEAPSTGDHVIARYDDNRNGLITCKETRRHGVAPAHRLHPRVPLHARRGRGRRRVQVESRKLRSFAEAQYSTDHHRARFQLAARVTPARRRGPSLSSPLTAHESAPGAELHPRSLTATPACISRTGRASCTPRSSWMTRCRVTR